MFTKYKAQVLLKVYIYDGGCHMDVKKFRCGHVRLERLRYGRVRISTWTIFQKGDVWLSGRRSWWHLWKLHKVTSHRDRNSGGVLECWTNTNVPKQQGLFSEHIRLVFLNTSGQSLTKCILGIGWYRVETCDEFYVFFSFSRKFDKIKN